MKKFLLILCALVCGTFAFAQNGYYTDNLHVTVNGDDEGVVKSTVSVKYTDEANGIIDLTLHDFSVDIYMGGWITVALGDLTVGDIQLGETVDGVASISCTDNSNVDYPDADPLYSSLITGISVNMTGDVSETKLRARMDITVSIILFGNYPVTATFGYDYEYLIVNAETGNYLGGGLDWGTHATEIGKPQFFTFTDQFDGTYTLYSHQGGTSLGWDESYSGLYVDAVNPLVWDLTEADGGYYIGCETGYLKSNGFQEGVTIAGTRANSTVWKLVTKDDIIATMADASADNPVDVTPLIPAPEPKNNNWGDSWVATGYNTSAEPANYSLGSTWLTASCAESYCSTNGFDIRQTIPDLPAGYYTLSAQAFYRNEGGGTVVPVMYINDAQYELPVLTTTANSMEEAYQEFLQELHTITADFHVDEDGTDVLVGFTSLTTTNNNMWTIFGELGLTYTGTEAPAKEPEDTPSDYQPGDVITVDGVEYTVQSDNLVPNHSFELGFEGWTSANDFTSEITSTYFKLVTAESDPDQVSGDQYLVGTGWGGSSSDRSLGTAWPIEEGKTYYFSYNIKNLSNAEETEYLKTSLTNTPGDEDSNNVLGYPASVSADWQTVEYVFDSKTFDYVQIKFRWLATEALVEQWGFDNFQLYEVEAPEEDPYIYDVTYALNNPSFELDDIETLEYDETRDAYVVESPEGWTLTGEPAVSDIMTVDATATDNNFGVPGEPSDGTQMLYLRNSWVDNKSVTLLQGVTLPAGDYKLTVDTKCVSNTGSTATMVAGEESVALTIHDTKNGTDETKENPYLDAWDTAVLTFTLTAETTLDLGVDIVFNGGNGSFLLDNFQLWSAEEIVITVDGNDNEYAAGDVAEIDGVEYAVVSDNMVVNGGFNDGVDGWTAGDGNDNYMTAADPANFTLETEGGFNDGAYITIPSTVGGYGSVSSPTQAIAVEEGKTYLFIGYTKGTAPTERNQAYNALVQMSDAYNEVVTSGHDAIVEVQLLWGAEPEETAEEWTKTEGVFTATTPYVGLRFSWCPNGSFDGIQLYEVEAPEVEPGPEVGEVVHECVAELSHWTIAGNTNGDFHYNDWSTETDPSGMVVPLLEYWVGSWEGNLSAATISHETLTGLAAGTYEVSLDVRIFSEAGNDIHAGTTLAANDANVDLWIDGTDGMYGTEVEVYGTYTVTCAVGDDGTLDISLNIPSGVSYNWIAFKNLKVKYVSDEVVEDQSYQFVCTDWSSIDSGRVTNDNISYDEASNTITVNAGTGANNVALSNGLSAPFTTANYTVSNEQNWYVVVASNISTDLDASQLWWMNGMNDGGSYTPDYIVVLGSEEILVAWDLSATGIDTYLQGDVNYLDGWTGFGLTSTTGTSVVSDINFYTWREAVAKYPELETAIATEIESVETAGTELAKEGIYTLSGMRLNKITKSGIYIVDGKKVLVK